MIRCCVGEIFGLMPCSVSACGCCATVVNFVDLQVKLARHQVMFAEDITVQVYVVFDQAVRDVMFRRSVTRALSSLFGL